MKRRHKIELAVLVALVAIVLGQAPRMLARGSNAYDFFDTLVDIRSDIVHHYVEEPDQKKMLEGSIQGMISALNDPFTDYFDPESLEAFDKQTRASFSGIGAELNVQDGNLVIVSPLDDSPAFKAGIVAGDVILEIDGKTTTGISADVAVKRITGPEGTPVTLKVRHLTGETNTYTLTRRHITVQTVKGFRRDAENHWDYMLDRTKGVGYVRLAQFSEPTADELQTAIDQMKKQGLKALIIDLRFNPGGLLEQAVRISDMFLSKGVIVSTKGRNSPKRVWEASTAGDVGDFPIAVLVNEGSASAAEILTGALKDNHRAVVIGTRSFGKGSVQQVMALPDNNGAIKVTIAYYYLPSGRNIHRRPGSDTWGVDPTDGFYVPMTFDQIRAMNKVRQQDDVLKKHEAEKGPAAAITADFVKDQMKDPQLAAAIKAVDIRLAKGDWEPVGQSNATLMAQVTERAALDARKTLLMDGLDKINQKLKELDQKIAKEQAHPVTAKADAKPADNHAATAATPAAAK